MLYLFILRLFGITWNCFNVKIFGMLSGFCSLQRLNVLSFMPWTINGFVNCIFSPSARWYHSSHSSHLLSLPSHAALGCSFNLLPLYQANPTARLCKHNKRPGCTPGSSGRTAKQTAANLGLGLLRPSCLPTLITQDIKARCFCRSQLSLTRKVSGGADILEFRHVS